MAGSAACVCHRPSKAQRLIASVSQGGDRGTTLTDGKLALKCETTDGRPRQSVVVLKKRTPNVRFFRSFLD